MIKKKIIILHITILQLILLFTFGCALYNNSSIPQIPVSLETIYKINLDFKPQKSCYDSYTKTIYIFEKETHQIHIYHSNTKINTIGGLGFEKTNFSNLSDITLASDGSILALDSYQKKIKKFDINGGWIAEFDIKGISYPVLFAVTINEIYYIFDEDSREIIRTKIFGDENLQSFGKFVVNKPEFIELNDNLLFIYDNFDNSTKIFNRFGDFVKEQKGYFLQEKNENFEIGKFFITSEHSDKKLGLSAKKIDKVFFENGYVIIQRDNEVEIAKFVY